MSPDNQQANARRNLLVHVLCWAFIIFAPLLFFRGNEGWNVVWLRFARSLGNPLACMIFFYLNYLWLVPRFYMSKHNRSRFFIINVGLIAILLGFMYGWGQLMHLVLPDMEHTLHHPHRGPRPSRLPMYFYNALMLALVAGLAMTLRMAQRWQHVEETRVQAEKVRTEAELSNLRNQLNPHFLLNTLNNIYALIAFDQDKAQTAVSDLSKLLRHLLYDNRQNYVPLYKEVEFMNNYVQLMKIRVTDNVKITLHEDIAPDDATPVAPLIFISLIENAFKHGVSQAGVGEISMTLHRDDEVISCEIINTNHPKRGNDKSGSGVGLEQVQKRLDLMYPGRYSWQKGLTPDGNKYYSKIEIHYGTDD